MSSTRVRCVALFLFVASMAVPCLAAEPGHSGESCGFPTYGGTYRPREFKSLNELPASIHQLVTQHISARVGPKFFGDLTFYRGQIVDVNQLHHEYPESKHFKW